MKDVLPLWLQDAAREQRNMAIRLRRAYDEFKDNSTPYARAHIRMADAREEAAEVFERAMVEARDAAARAIIGGES